MKVMKIGHCCLVVEEAGLKILTDPGGFSAGQNEITGVDAVLISHEHPDHLHVDSVKKILANNPTAKILTNKAVGKILDQENLPYELLEDGQSAEVAGVLVEGKGTEHAEIYGDFGKVINTGYFIANRLFYPGDAFTNPGKQVEILALPIVGPWMKSSEAIDYAKAINPKIAFPVHDALLGEFGEPFYKVPAQILSETNIEFKTIKAGDIFEV